MYTPYQDYIQKLKDTKKYRKLTNFRQDKISSFLDFSSNDYLGLSYHPEILDASINAIQDYGWGIKASRVSAKGHPLYEHLETQIALDKGTQAALFFSSGFQANLSVLSALLDFQTLKVRPIVFSDRLNHASIYQALLLSQCRWLRYRHLDMEHLNDLLEQEKKNLGLKFIVTESVFGMDGDKAPLEKIYEFALKYNAFVYLDEAHATGLFGPHGYGCSTLYNWERVPHVIMGTFSKALGGIGAYVACSQTIKEYLINKAQGFIYSTASPPCVVAAALQAWNKVRMMRQEREHLITLGIKLRAILKDLGADTGTSITHIIPVILKQEDLVLRVQQKFLEHHIYVSGIRPPTVPLGQARLRLGLCSHHTEEDLHRFINVWKKIKHDKIL
ncbi:putative 8-amino-7-oxononanoate synthase [Holospora obtusa F1]|uniref:8-amino-7-oxononanoate synthase n=1 Tax=Holospora obtusa F1 TaxID=1399147 RepID=W6TS46_HOLOB|nr:aminotransferase class I/II-fold pyridoxal phosphate-dependent enzyme [Holospora obtusa]ETZ06677.1 putative 8-amino-7-oxononanoate synthase [Holospora obtusa F1]